MPTPTLDLVSIVKRLANRRPGRTEANVQSDLHMLLTVAPLNLDDNHVDDIVLGSRLAVEAQGTLRFAVEGAQYELNLSEKEHEESSTRLLPRTYQPLVASWSSEHADRTQRQQGARSGPQAGPGMG